jgi:hypothetical protein
MGRLGLLALAKGNWNGKQLVPSWFVEELEKKQTRGMRANYDGPNDGQIGMDPKQFPEAPYGFLTWVNSDGDLLPGADSGWAYASGAGGFKTFWNRSFGIVFATAGATRLPRTRDIPHILESRLLSGARSSAETVLDLDFRQGSFSNPRIAVHGGKWDNGWNVTGDTDRILIDLERDIRDGSVEVVVTRTGELNFTERKRNWLGVFASPAGHQSAGGYARAGAEMYGFSKAEIFASTGSSTICEKKFGEASDWILDGKTEHVVRVEVKNNVMTWSNGRSSASCGGDGQPVNYFRWIMLGGVLDHKLGWHNGSLVGLKFLRLRVIDSQPAPEPGVAKR